REPTDLERLPELQRAILTHASRLLAPGGRLVYAVCSVLDEEGPNVVDAVLAADPSLQATRCARLLPAQHGTDGYFFAVLVKTS
ncbi:MAG: SAM-dependent methyltransferase, partial [Proteobacteria bacterium]